MSASRLIVDTDGGVDDAQALMMLAGAGRSPFAVTTVFGNVPLDVATDNVLAVLATVGCDAPVHKGAIGPLIGQPVNAQDVHGDDGLGGAPRPPRQSRPAPENAVDFLRRRLLEAAASGDKIDLLMLGPLTNLALALRLDPAIVGGIGRLVIMGATRNGRGNVTPAAEFNIYADPEAAEIVFSSGLAITLIPWESCLDHSLAGEAVVRCTPDQKTATRRHWRSPLRVICAPMPCGGGVAIACFSLILLPPPSPSTRTP